MSSPISKNDQSQLDQLAEEYAIRKRSGEQPDIEQYAREYPTLAKDIRELFPVLEILDNAKAKAKSKNRRDDSGQDGYTEIGAGTMLGEYQLLRPIGRGGMGIVYQAEHLTLGSVVAIKILPASLDRPKLRERFQREASAAARMQHPNIVQVFDFGKHEASLYFVMQLVSGWGLDRVISRSDDAGTISSELLNRKDSTPTRAELVLKSSFAESQYLNEPSTDLEPVDPVETKARPNPMGSSIGSRPPSGSSGSTLDSLWIWVADLGIQAADALSYAHAIGVVHRDIKPSNLMVDEENTLFVTDFGLAKVAGDNELTATGDLLGTLRYMPPEALSGKSDHRADIYGLGLTLYELLADGPALAEVERGKILAAISTGDIERLRKRVPKVPRDLETIIQKSIEPDPADRYQSAAELRDDLQRFLTGKPVLARRTTWVYRASRWVSRNVIVSTLATGVILLLCAVALLATINAGRFEKLAREKAAETTAAQTAENDARIARQAADAQTRTATENLLAANLSDASGFASSRRIGQRVEGTKALRSAISLARELDVFPQHRDRINSTAAILSTLHDLPSEVQWKHPVTVSGYAPVAFNGNLSEYAHEDFRDKPSCKIYRVGSDQPELVEAIPLEGHFGEMSLDMSDDGHLLSALMTWKENGKSVTRPWVYDRRNGATHFPEAEGDYWQLVEAVKMRPASHEVIILNRSHQLVLFDSDLGKVVSRFELPKENWSQISVSPDGRYVAVIVRKSNHVVLIDIESGSIRRPKIEEKKINELAWRPDNRQFAIAGEKLVSVWDLKSESFCSSFEHGETSATELQYSADGRLLLVGGWKNYTQAYDALTGKRVLRCEQFLLESSSNGRRMVFVANRHFEVRSLVTSDTVWEYGFGAVARESGTGIDARSGTLWLTPEFAIQAVDLSQHRIVSTERTKYRQPCVVVDPLGRDVIVSKDDTIQQLPIAYHTADNESEQKQAVEIGPSLLRYKPKTQRDFRPYKVRLTNDGEYLAITGQPGHDAIIVSSRKRNWLPLSFNFTGHWSVRAAKHPNLPLICTSSHHLNHVEVRNIENGKVVFRQPGKQTQSVFSISGDSLFTCSAGTMRKYELNTWKLLAETDDECAIAKSFMALSQDGRWIAVETLSPRGVLLVDSEELKPVLRLPGDPSFPDSFIGSFDATGRFLAADRGIGVIGVWDLHKLRQHFESLDLDWPAPGLGNATPVRDPAIDVNVNWNRTDAGYSEAQHKNFYKQFPNWLLQKIMSRKAGTSQPVANDEAAESGESE